MDPVLAVLCVALARDSLFHTSTPFYAKPGTQRVEILSIFLLNDVFYIVLSHKGDVFYIVLSRKGGMCRLNQTGNGRYPVEYHAAVGVPVSAIPPTADFML